MPLVYQQNINESTRLGVWHITEKKDFFLANVPLQQRITHPHKALQHLAGRYLLTVLFENFPLELIRIADTNKPFLPNEAYHFSISHCGDYAAAMVSKANRVGVDIEVISEKVIRIKDKFLTVMEQEMLSLNSGLFILNAQMLTTAWCIKESMFKWYGAGGIDFKQHLHIENFLQRDNEFFAECIISKADWVALNLHGLKIANKILTWTLT